MDVLQNYPVYVVETLVILSIVVFLAYILYSLGLFKFKK